MKIKLKEKYMPRSKAIQMILRRKGWNIIPCGEEGEYILIDADQEDQENFIRWFCGETTWSPAGQAPRVYICPDSLFPLYGN